MIGTIRWDQQYLQHTADSKYLTTNCLIDFHCSLTHKELKNKRNCTVIMKVKVIYFLFISFWLSQICSILQNVLWTYTHQRVLLGVVHLRGINNGTEQGALNILFCFCARRLLYVAGGILLKKRILKTACFSPSIYLDCKPRSSEKPWIFRGGQ